MPLAPTLKDTLTRVENTIGPKTISAAGILAPASVSATSARTMTLRVPAALGGRPRSKGGTDDPDNLQLLCGACNSTKGDRTQAELVAALRETGVLR